MQVGSFIAFFKVIIFLNTFGLFRTMIFIALCSLEPDPKKLATLRSDVSLSSCEVKVKPHKCGENGCGEGSLDVTAVTDFVEDGDRTSRIATARVRGSGVYGWEAHDPPDVEVCNLPISIHCF